MLNHPNHIPFKRWITSRTFSSVGAALLGLWCCHVGAQAVPDAGALLRQTERNLNLPSAPMTPPHREARPAPEVKQGQASVTVVRFQFKGNTRLSDEQLQTSVAPFIGRPLNFLALQQAADAVATALRETEEEVGLARRHVEVIGRLPVYTTVTGFAVTPVVGLVAPGFDLRIDSDEVDEAFEVPLAFLMDPANHQRRLYRWSDGGERSFFAMPWTGPTGDEHFIWGVTAAMIRNLYRFVSA